MKRGDLNLILDFVFQLRLDFDSFSITGPSTSTTTSAKLKILNGITDGAGAAVTTASQCLTDSFSVTSSNGNSPPTICGNNAGKHSK